MHRFCRPGSFPAQILIGTRPANEGYFILLLCSTTLWSATYNMYIRTCVSTGCGYVWMRSPSVCYRIQMVSPPVQKNQSTCQIYFLAFTTTLCEDAHITLLVCLCSINELVQHQHNGLLFKTPESLASQIKVRLFGCSIYVHACMHVGVDTWALCIHVQNGFILLIMLSFCTHCDLYSHRAWSVDFQEVTQHSRSWEKTWYLSKV